ncbi:MAG: flagellar biosynthetic protein FlhB [Burkholderiales bacterium PBB4]|nr:MAG: flagellar biosynthetic protein FlhB [Burkholderiales bacterium PBB4]
MDQGSQDRNLPASERKLQKAREDGQVSRSEDLKHLAVLGTGSVAVLALAPVLFERLKHSVSQQLAFDATTVQQSSSMLKRLSEASTTGLMGCVVFALIVMASVVLASVASGGWVSSLKPITPDFSRLNPLSGLTNLFGKKKLLDVAKMTLILCAIAASYLSKGLEGIALLILQPSSSSIRQVTDWISSGLGLLLLVILFVAMADVPLQKFLHGDQMKMSHQEMKEEGKESDGNPQMKAKIRQRQRDLAQKSSVGAVPKADFIVMNPTHFAVAVKYDDQTMNAPQVISKGADLLAMRIRDIAKSNAIPVLQSPMLARALYANAELNKDIPAALYTAVAQVMAYVYRLRAALNGNGPMPQDLVQPFVPPELDPLSKTVKAELV